MQLISKVIYGSKLYGTSIPESDDDFRGIFLPSIEDCLLGKDQQTISSKTEEDTTLFSLQYFLELAAQGQSIAIEMLSAPLNKTVIKSQLWDELRKNRKLFFTKNMHSFLGFAKTMSGKYSVRIDRLNEVENILMTLEFCLKGQEEQVYTKRLKDVWDGLPESVNAIKTVNQRSTNEDKRVYQVCGRELQATAKLDHVINVIQNIRDSYGERVRKAKNGDIEWKSLAHAFRATLQCKEIVETGDLVFPLKDADWLRDLRLGKINFHENKLDEKLDNLIDEVQELIDKSSLPELVDRDWIEDFILKAYKNV